MRAEVAPRWRILIAVGLTVVVLDQVSKFLAVRYLTPGIANAHFARSGHPFPDGATRVRLMGELGSLRAFGLFYADVVDPCRPVQAYCPTVAVVSGFWNWRYVENPGAAWGLLATAPAFIRLPFFYAVSAGAIVFILWFYRRLQPDQTLLAVALSLVFGGAIGNFIDRLHLTYVIDFIDWYAGQAHWPTFNVADAGITVGVLLLIVDMIIHRETNPTTEARISEK